MMSKVFIWLQAVPQNEEVAGSQEPICRWGLIDEVLLQGKRRWTCERKSSLRNVTQKEADSVKDGLDIEKQCKEVSSKGWEARQVEQSCCYISINGGLEREVNQAEHGEDAHREEESQTKNGQRRSRKLDHGNKEKTLFQGRANREVKK